MIENCVTSKRKSSSYGKLMLVLERVLQNNVILAEMIFKDMPMDLSCEMDTFRKFRTALSSQGFR